MPARDMLELYGAAKVPHWNRDALARMLGRAPSSMHLHEGHTGGGFGVRGELYPEDVLACLGALRLGRPVKWIEDRREHLIATNHSRQQHYRVRAAVDEDGRLLAIDGEFFHDQGAYVRTHAATVPDLAATMLLGPYRVAAYRMAGHIRLTNKTPCGTYRAPGRFESTFVRERLMDAIAARLQHRSGRNPPPQSHRHEPKCPMRAARHARHRNDLRFRRLCRAARQGAGRSRLAKICSADLQRRRAEGETVGAGFAMFVEKSGLGPYDGVRATHRHQRHGRNRHRRDVGRPGHGNRARANLRRRARRRLSARARGARPDRPHRLRHGRLCLAGHGDDRRSDAHRAAAKLRAKAIAAAAASVADRRPKRSTSSTAKWCAKTPRKGRRSTLGEVARALTPARNSSAMRCPAFPPKAGSSRSHMTYPYGVHFAVVRVDRDTGAIVGRALFRRL